MFSCADAWRRATLLAVAGACLEGWAAGPASGRGTQIVAPREDLPAATSQRPQATLPTLRCWQEGRLVLERSGIELAETPAGAVVFRGKDGDRPVWVYDMKHGVCAVTHERAAASAEAERSETREVRHPR